MNNNLGAKPQNLMNALKIYLFPSLVSVVSVLIWRDVTELRTDVKMLLAQSNQDKVKIQNLEKHVESLEKMVLYKRTAYTNNVLRAGLTNLLFKHEEFFDVNQYIPKKS